MIFTRLINYVSGYTAVSLETAQQVADMLGGPPLPVVRRRQDSQGELLQLINLFAGLDRERFQVRDVNAIENGSGCTPGLIGDVALRARRRTRLVTLAFAVASMPPGWDWTRTAVAQRDDGRRARGGGDRRLERDPRGRAGERPAYVPEPDLVANRRPHARPHVPDGRRGRGDRPSALGRVNDNPIFLGPAQAPPNGRVISTGGFHNPGAYHTMNWLSAAWADLAVLAARQAEKLHLNVVTGLPADLASDGRRSGTRLLVVTSYDLASRAREHAVPALIPLYSGRRCPDRHRDADPPCLREGGARLALFRHLPRRPLRVLEPGTLRRRSRARSGVARLPGRRAGRFPPVEGPRDLGAEAQRLADDFAEAAVGGVTDFEPNA